VRQLTLSRGIQRYQRAVDKVGVGRQTPTDEGWKSTSHPSGNAVCVHRPPAKCTGQSERH
jgi:hypothetical protein